MSDVRTLAFIGLGTMGGPMAGNLSRAGHRVAVYNRTPKRAENWVKTHGGAARPTPREAASGAEIVFACIVNDNDLRQVTLGPDGAFAGMNPGAIFIDHSTASAELARELAQRAAERGIDFLDAPVSGGPVNAEKGLLTIMVGGRPEIFARAEPLLRHSGRNVALMGPTGAGQLTKMVNQICIAGVLQGLSEGIAFAERANLNVEKALDVMKAGAAQSWQMENRGPTMAEGKFDFGFAVDWMRKDLSLILDEARRNGARVPLIALVDQFYAAVQGRGGGRWDTSSLVTLLRDHA